VCLEYTIGFVCKIGYSSSIEIKSGQDLIHPDFFSSFECWQLCPKSTCFPALIKYFLDMQMSLMFSAVIVQ